MVNLVRFVLVFGIEIETIKTNRFVSNEPVQNKPKMPLKGVSHEN